MSVKVLKYTWLSKKDYKKLAGWFNSNWILKLSKLTKLTIIKIKLNLQLKCQVTMIAPGYL